MDISKVDKKELYELLTRKIYDKKKYKKGLKGLGHVEKMVGKAFPLFDAYKRKWNFTVSTHTLGKGKGCGSYLLTFLRRYT